MNIGLAGRNRLANAHTDVDPSDDAFQVPVCPIHFLPELIQEYLDCNSTLTLSTRFHMLYAEP
jgi:hypothetical protein